LIVDNQASYAQAAAMVKALKARLSSALGEVVAVKKAPLAFSREGKSYTVASAGLATIDVEAMPEDLCCTMPHLVWYQPLVLLNGRKVGYTKKARYSGDVVSEPWERSGENSAFYGTFAMRGY
jgi:hypothetical protein